ncbi:MAG: hypothetical protein ABL931_09270 [Usitatibacteraceae bacterium]
MHSLQPNPRTRAPSRSNFTAVLAACLLVAAPLVAMPARAESLDLIDLVVRIFTPGRSINVVESSPDRVFQFKAKGQVTFTAAEDDIERLERRVYIMEKRAGKTRRIDFKPAGANGVERIYKVDGREQPLDAEGRRWLAEMIAATIRELPQETSLRIARLQAKGGVAAVLSEIELINSDFARRNYVEHLVKLGPLDEKSQNRLIAAVARMRGDFERRNALLAVIDTQSLPPAQQVATLNAVAKMQSAFEQRSVLEALTPKLVAEPGVNNAWQLAIAKVHSDFEVRTILVRMAEREVNSPAQTEMVLVATQKIHSDFERATVLKAMVKHLPKSGETARAEFFRSANKINSDFERRGVLTALIESGDLDRSTYFPLLDSIGAINSGHEKHVALLTAAKRMPRDAELLGRYREVARRLGDHERGQVERALDQVKS